jgi:hypothetical protein
MQMMVVASPHPSDSIETLIKNFGTDLWLGVFLHSIVIEQCDENNVPIPGTSGFQLKSSLFANVPRFDAAKLGNQVRQLLLQLI